MVTCTGNKALKGGPAIIHVRSETFSKEDIKATVSAFDPRTEVPSAADGLGFVLSERNSYMEFTLPDGCDVSIHDIAGACNATVTFRLVNGKAYSMREAWFASDDLGFSSDQGDLTMRFESQFPMEEVLGC